VALSPPGAPGRPARPDLDVMASGSHIVPVVGTLDASVAAARSGEVDRIMWVPLAELTQQTRSGRRCGIRRRSRPIFLRARRRDDLGCHGALLHQLLRVALGIDGPEPPAL
jgi:hypothetical protein